MYYETAQLSCVLGQERQRARGREGDRKKESGNSHKRTNPLYQYIFMFDRKLNSGKSVLKSQRA